MNCHDHNIASHVEFFRLVMQSSPTSGRKCDEPLRTSAWEAGSQYCLIQNWVLYLHYFIFYGYQYQRKEEKWHMYILTYINLPLWSWWQLNLFPERKEGPLSLKSFLKLKITFSVKKKNAVNMTYPTILIATMLLVKGLLSDTVEEEAGQKKLKIKKISCKSNNFAEA